MLSFHELLIQKSLFDLDNSESFCKSIVIAMLNKVDSEKRPLLSPRSIGLYLQEADIEGFAI